MKIRNINDALLFQSELDNFKNYCSKNNLFLNPEKCFMISFSRNHNKIVYNLGDIDLLRKQGARDLGVFFDEKMIFSEHIEAIVSKAFRMLGFIHRQARQFTSNKALLSLYYAYVYSQLNFASSVWNPMYHIYINRLGAGTKKIC